MNEPREHYSYTYYADPTNARTFDERRFGGPIGDLVASDQAAVLARFAESAAGRTVLDVGTGTGRAALQLAQAGGKVTGVDASEQMLAIARDRAARASTEITFLECDAHALTFSDRSFELVVCLRVLMHTPRWRVCISELCRVAERLVILDYPSARSAALLQSFSRTVLSGLGVRNEPYRVFSDAAIRSALAESGFRVTAMHRHFALPIAVHKAIGSRRFTVAAEGLLQRLGALALFGSPVTLVAERCGSS